MDLYISQFPERQACLDIPYNAQYPLVHVYVHLSCVSRHWAKLLDTFGNSLQLHVDEHR